MSERRCFLARCNGANTSNAWRELSWSRKDWLRSCSWGMPAHCSACFSLQSSSASLYASSAKGRKHFGWFTYAPVSVWMGVFTYPLNVVVPRISETSWGWLEFHIWWFSSGVAPKTGSTGWTGVSVGIWWSVFGCTGGIPGIFLMAVKNFWGGRCSVSLLRL